MTFQTNGNNLELVGRMSRTYVGPTNHLYTLVETDVSMTSCRRNLPIGPTAGRRRADGARRRHDVWTDVSPTSWSRRRYEALQTSSVKTLK